MSRAKNVKTDSETQFRDAKQLALTEPLKACGIFTELSKKNDFILADVAYVKTLAYCPKEQLQLDRPVAGWLEKEKQLANYQSLQTPVEKALFISKNPQYFTSPDRIKAYQQALREPTITPEDKLPLETALYAIAPRFMPNPPVSDYFKIAKDLKSIRDYDKAKDLLRTIIKDPLTTPENKLQALKDTFFLLKLQREQKKSQYLHSAKEWADFIKPSKALSPALIAGMTEAKINHARVIWTENGAEQALKLIEQTKKQLSGKVSLFDVYWLKARMLEELKKPEEAIAEYEKALKEKITNWRDQEKILWNLAWTYFKRKNYSGAHAHLITLIAHKETSPYARFKYSFWLGETLFAEGKTEEAKVMWKSVSDEDTFGYYGLVSLYKNDLPLRPITRNNELARGISEKDDEVFKALQRVEEFDLASRFLGAVLPDSGSLRKAPASDVASVLKLYGEVFNYKYVFQLFTQLPFEVQREVFAAVPDILFPQPYGPAIIKATEMTQVPPELIYSIMRQESSFDPQARSPMDALGLTQVLPDVAKKIAREHDIPFAGFDDLFQEDKSILIGAYLLKRQIAMFNNKFPLYVASYNASGAAVRGWHKRHEGTELMFIEDVPYEETKTYVKLVLRNFILYKKLKEGDAFSKFPAELIENQ